MHRPDGDYLVSQIRADSPTLDPEALLISTSSTIFLDLPDCMAARTQGTGWWRIWWHLSPMGIRFSTTRLTNTSRLQRSPLCPQFLFSRIFKKSGRNDQLRKIKNISNRCFLKKLRMFLRKLNNISQISYNNWIARVVLKFSEVGSR